MNNIISVDKQYVAGTYGRFPVEIISGNGSIAIDSQGKEYIDMGTGIGVTCMGYSDPQWVKAITDQLNKLQHTSNLYYTEPCAMLAKELCERTGMAKVFFSNSGAEANECAIKVARKYSQDKKGEDCYTIVTLVNSFHGRTLTTLAATGQDHFHKLFNPLTPGFVHVAAEDFDQLAHVVANTKVAGIMMELVQGEGGVIALSQEYVSKVAKLAEEQDIPLIIDEVQTGNGRTGSLYAFMAYGIRPDVVSTAKGLGGGLPIGATIMSAKVQNVLGPGDQGSTYGGNPVASAGALNVISCMDQEFLQGVRDRSQYVFGALNGAKGIKSVTGMGLMIGIETERPAKDIVNECMEMGVLCLTAKTKVRLLPALNIPMDLLAKAVDIIKTVAAKE